jgi:hypothetical protein
VPAAIYAVTHPTRCTATSPPPAANPLWSPGSDLARTWPDVRYVCLIIDACSRRLTEQPGSAAPASSGGSA